MIKKVQGGYKVVSKSGKDLSKVYSTKEQAEKRLREIEYFKHKKEK
jgi:hypothetical protein